MIVSHKSLYLASRNSMTLPCESTAKSGLGTTARRRFGLFAGSYSKILLQTMFILYREIRKLFVQKTGNQRLKKSIHIEKKTRHLNCVAGSVMRNPHSVEKHFNQRERRTVSCAAPINGATCFIHFRLAQLHRRDACFKDLRQTEYATHN